MNEQTTLPSNLDPRPSNLEEPPPIGKSWRRLYTAVLLNLALLIAIFYAFTKAFE